MSEHFGPEDTWPRHQKDYWRDALTQAREAGWSLTYLNAPHLWGRVVCPGGEHGRKVGQTARGNETHAKELIKNVGACARRGCGVDPDAAAARQADVEALLATADQLVSTSEASLDLFERRLVAEAELSRLDAVRARLATAAINVQESLGGATLDAEEDRALAVAIEASGPDAPTIRRDLDKARDASGEAEAQAQALRPMAEANVARERAKGLAVRIRAALIRLDDLQERFGGADS